MKQYIPKAALVAEMNKLKDISLEYGYTTEQRIVADVGKDLTLKGLLDYIDTLEVKEVQEEPVSEGLEECTSEIILEGTNFNKSWYAHPELAFKAGVNWQKNHLWKPADGDDLPEIDREVIALLDNGKVVFVHRPPEYWDGKSIVTGKVTRYYPETYGKGGWNIPDVKWWLDCLLPNLEEG